MRNEVVAALVLLAGCASSGTSSSTSSTSPKATSIAVVATEAASAPSLESRASPLQVIVVRLVPGSDPKPELERVVRERGIEAAFVLSAVGSLTRAMVRFADQRDATLIEGKHEVVSLVGMISTTGGSHLHVALADGEGRTKGGHLKEGSAVYTTLEVALGVAPSLRFIRAPDERSGYSELWIQDR